MKNLFTKIKSSLYDPVFYEHIRTQSITEAVKIFIVLGLVGVLFSIFPVVPSFLSFAYSNLPNAIEMSYPDDLVITIKDGAMSINKPQPYYIKNTLPIFEASSSPKYLAIFDGTNKLPNDIEEISTFILLKDKYAITLGQNQQQQIIPFSRMGTSTVQIEKKNVVEVVDKVKPYFVPMVLGGGTVLFILGTLFGALFWIIFHILYLLLPALLIFLLMLLLRNPKLTFKESYMIALYASIPVAILFFIFETLVRPAPEYTYTILLLLIALINTIKRRK